MFVMDMMPLTEFESDNMTVKKRVWIAYLRHRADRMYCFFKFTFHHVNLSERENTDELNNRLPVQVLLNVISSV